MRSRDTEPLRGGDRRLFGGAQRQRAFHRVADELVDGARIAEANLGFLRVDVDIDAPRVELEPQRERGLPVVVQHVAIGLAQRMLQHAVADVAAVDEQVLPAALRGKRRPHGEAREPDARGLGVDRRRMHDKIVTQQLLDAHAPARRDEPMHDARVVREREAGRRMGERDAAERLLAMRPFGRLGAQELAPGRRVEEQLLDGDAGSRRQRGRGDRAHRAAVDLDAPRVRLLLRARSKSQARHRRDRRERLAAKSQRRDRLQVEDRADL